MVKMIPPHGGKLVQRIVDFKQATNFKEMASHLPSIYIDSWTLSDLELIATGAFSPLTGFIGNRDYQSVLKNMRLSNGTVWTIPITLPVTNNDAAKLEIGTEIGLKGLDGKLYGVLKLEEKYKYNKQVESELIYGTTNMNHPGVQKLFTKGDVYLAGPIYLVKRPSHSSFESYFNDPIESGRHFKIADGKQSLDFKPAIQSIGPMSTFKKRLLK